MGVIFALSSGLGGADHTSRFIGPLLRWLMPHAAPETIAQAHFLIRKAAHLTEYAVLALLTLRAVRRSLNSAAGDWSWKAAGLALLISAGYAATDEFHQTFVPGRTPSAGDVLIDSTGVALALAAARRKTVAEASP